MTKSDVVAPATPNAAGSAPNSISSKVPEVTAFFGIVKVLCTTVGETASDFLNVNLGVGSKGTAVAAGRYVQGICSGSSTPLTQRGIAVVDTLDRSK